MDWEDLRYFVALARHGSLSAAARALKVNHATVARRIGALETSLGRVLFDRRADGYALTMEGRAILADASAMEEAAFGLLRRLDGESVAAEVSGPVRLTTTHSLASGFLVRRLAGLAERYPAIDIDVAVEVRVVSLARREADMALRYGRPSDSALVGRRVGRIGSAFYAAPEWRDRLMAGDAAVFVGFEADNDLVPEAAWLADRFSRARFAFRSNSLSAQRDAAVAGFGVALLPHFLAVHEPDLCPVDLGCLPPLRDLWLLLRPELAKVPRMRAVADFLDELCHRESRFLERGSQDLERNNRFKS
jgi:DNA-binding transcriptional LysR family regulator